MKLPINGLKDYIPGFFRWNRVYRVEDGNSGYAYFFDGKGMVYHWRGPGNVYPSEKIMPVKDLKRHARKPGNGISVTRTGMRRRDFKNIVNHLSYVSNTLAYLTVAGKLIETDDDSVKDLF